MVWPLFLTAVGVLGCTAMLARAVVYVGRVFDWSRL